MKLDSRQDYRRRRHLRARKVIRGTAACPRMSVFRSNRQLYVQFVDDEQGRTLAAASTLSGDLQAAGGGRLNVDKARQLGALAARAAQTKGITTVVFDRGGFAYHGQIKAVADGAREAGLKF